MNLPLKIIIVSAINIAIIDSGLYYRLKKHPESFTLPLLVALIFFTILPIALSTIVW
jgi:hypothetical protein